ncbi:hypothetical protein [Tolypothrix sp. VBCCA 56010]|uniref:hypothetical protein n=1 Tax=Tolypothrix sp. VBCCA 56010 TaxID=3137731 RepID=UPI003D7D5AB1
MKDLIQFGPGDSGNPELVTATYRQPNADTLNTAFNTINAGVVVVYDERQRGKATLSGTTRTVVGGTPDYSAGNGPNTPVGNVTVLDSSNPVAASSPTKASRAKALVYVGGKALSNGQEGQFVKEGIVQALLSGAADPGDRLSLDISGATAATAGRLKVAAANDIVQAVCRQKASGAGKYFVEMLATPYQTTTAGNA